MLLPLLLFLLLYLMLQLLLLILFCFILFPKFCPGDFQHQQQQHQQHQQQQQQLEGHRCFSTFEKQIKKIALGSFHSYPGDELLKNELTSRASEKLFPAASCWAFCPLVVIGSFLLQGYSAKTQFWSLSKLFEWSKNSISSVEFTFKFA